MTHKAKAALGWIEPQSILVSGMVMILCMMLGESRAEDPLLAKAPDSKQIAGLIEQLNAPNHAERRRAFLNLCDPAVDLDSWSNTQGAIAKDPQVEATLVWLKRIRSLPGPLDAKLDAACDYPALAQGSMKVVERYAQEGKLDMLMELIKLLPRSSLDAILQNSFAKGENGLQSIFDRAWALGRPDLIPKMLDALIPPHPMRVGLNRRWNSLGLGDSWKISVPLESTDVQVIALESEGQIDQAAALAKKSGRPEAIEKLLLRNSRWNQWLELDPSRLSLVSAAWSELPRALILEALDRHDEAKAFYEIRKASAKASAQGALPRGTSPKEIESQVLATQLALLTGDTEAVFANLKDNAPVELMNMYFLHNRIDPLFESEDLAVRTEKSVSNWLDRNVAEGKGFTKVVRFQALFRRIGESAWSKATEQRVFGFIESQPRDQQLLLWKDYLQQIFRYGLEELRPVVLARALSKIDSEPPAAKRLNNPVAGFPEAQAERIMTLEDLFPESFPHMKEASYPLYRALKREHPEKTDLQVLEWLQQLHQGVRPEGWSMQDVRSLFQSAITIRRNEGIAPAGIVLDLAEALDAMGATNDGIDLLSSLNDSLSADLMRSKFLARLGKYTEARSLVLDCQQRSPGSLEVYQWASELFAELGEENRLKWLDQRFLTRTNGMEDFSVYSKDMRRTERFELAEPIGRFLQVQFDSSPSSLADLWLEDVYWIWNLSLLANQYHQSVPDHPERIDRTFDLTLMSSLFDIFSEFDSESGMNLQLARGRTSIGWDMDWTRWSWRYERVLAAGFWQAVSKGDRGKADRFLRAAHRINPEQINTLIDAVPWVLEKFGRQTLEEWFRIYYGPMQEQLKQYPEDILIANNSAWLAVKCGFEIDRAMELSKMVTDRYPSDTYLDTLAEVHFVKGELDRAIEISLRCQKLNPRDPHHRRQLQRYGASRLAPK